MFPLSIAKFNSKSRQVALAVVGVVVLGGILIGAYLIFVRPHYDVLFTSLREVDAATIVEQLDKEKIPYKIKDGGTTILVPKERVDKTRLALMGSSLPLKGTVGFELFNKSDMGVTEFAQKINYQRALQGELARTIMSMDGIEEARIHLALSEQTIFKDDRNPPKASVTVLSKPGRALTDKTIQGIQRLVAAAVPELEVGNVVVLDGKGDVVSSTLADTASSAWSEQKRAVEQIFANKIRDNLGRVFPSGHFNVTVSAVIAPDAIIPNPREVMRDYGLSVSVLAAEDIRLDQKEYIRTVISQAIQSDPNIVDTIDVLVGQPPLPQNINATQIDKMTGDAVGGRIISQYSASDIRTAIFAFLFMALLAAVVLMRGFSAGNRQISAEEKEKYANRLKAVLNGVGVHDH